jgi:nucleoside-diphosphate-sugar epimerase
MRVGIVGGTGNISTPIVRLLIDQGHEVTCVNRGKTPGLHPKAKQIVVDRKEDVAGFEKAMREQKFDWAIDMLCSFPQFAASDLRAFAGVKHFIQCSTVCTYGVDYDWLPVSEDHPLRPATDYGRNKVAADHIFMDAYHKDGFPVTIMKPSTTFGPTWDMLRQASQGPDWVDRVRKGKPILVCGDGRALHQFLYVDDAAPGFVFALGRDRCVGQTYNIMKPGYTTWEQYHKTAMKVIGREVEMVGVPLAAMLAAKVPNVGLCESIFSYNTIYSPYRLMRDVPEFRPKISLEEALTRVLKGMTDRGSIPDSSKSDWEDRLIAAQRKVGQTTIA